MAAEAPRPGKRAKLIHALAAFAEHPWVNLIAGLALLVTGCTEIWRTFEGIAVGAEHGVALYGLVHILRTLPEFLHGAEHISKTQERA